MTIQETREAKRSFIRGKYDWYRKRDQHATAAFNLACHDTAKEFHPLIPEDQAWASADEYKDEYVQLIAAGALGGKTQWYADQYGWGFDAAYSAAVHDFELHDNGSANAPGDIVDQWPYNEAKKYVRKRVGGIKKVEKMLGFKLLKDDQSMMEGAPEFVATQTFVNHGDTEQQQNFIVRKDFKRSATCTLTTSFEFSFGMETSIEAKLEFEDIGGIKSTMSVDYKQTLNKEFTDSQTDEITQTYEYNSPIKVPPHSTVTVDATATKAIAKVPWEMDVQLESGQKETVSGVLTCDWGLGLKADINLSQLPTQ